jgi:hypothetical protein
MLSSLRRFVLRRDWFELVIIEAGAIDKKHANLGATRRQTLDFLPQT